MRTVIEFVVLYALGVFGAFVGTKIFGGTLGEFHLIIAAIIAAVIVLSGRKP